MYKNFDQLKNLIATLPFNEEREKVDQLLARIKKDIAANEFKLQRTLKDKSIAVNLLNASIEDLQNKQAIIEETNEVLSKQKREIEIKNLELSYQKQLVEDQSIKLKQNLQELERSYRELEQFSYIASHDLKSPLRTIANFAQLLQKRYLGKLDQQADEFINFIVAGANNMNAVINDLLEYSRVGIKEKDFAEADLNDLLDLVQFNLADAIQKEKVSIIATGLPTLLVNKQGITQLFQNLIGNAIKFRGTTDPEIQIDCKKENDKWLFSLADNGVGMDEGYQKKAFQPFQRLNNRDRPGTGMGLAICKKVVNLHQGDIWFRSKVGKGTTFFFTLHHFTDARAIANRQAEAGLAVN